MPPMSTIIPYTTAPPCGALFLGSIEVSIDTDVLCANSISHIVQVMGRWPVPLENEGYTYHSVPIVDRIDEKIMPYLEGACAFIEEHRRRGKNVLVHCFEVQVPSTYMMLGGLCTQTNAFDLG
jgi:hypothetical protein